jgi:fumarate hydratase, class II
MQNTYRTEKDSLGEVKVPHNAYWGAQTQRSIDNFKIGSEKMPEEMIHALSLVKLSAAYSNHELKVLSTHKYNLISKVCKEIMSGELKDQFPLSLWQTGSGTQTNMNLNEVIANRAHVLNGGMLTDSEKILHPNDDVNMSQSSNDVFPTAMHIAAYLRINQKLIPVLTQLIEVLNNKADEYADVIKTGRTHWMDATPISFKQEFGAYAQQLVESKYIIEQNIKELLSLVLGGTATGTGLNAPEGFAEIAIEQIAEHTGYAFVPAKNRFVGMAAHDALVNVHSSLKRLAISLIKIAGDIRFMASGPRGGIAEIQLPANEPGSSIMPGKVNPTQAEALLMVCYQILGNDTAISAAGASGHMELNVAKPLIIQLVLSSAGLLTDAIDSFTNKAIKGIVVNKKQVASYLENSLMLVTALNKEIGYEKAVIIAQSAYKNGIKLREAAINSGFISAKVFDELSDPKKMI